MDEYGEKIPREREESLCPCKSKLSYAECCLPFHYGRAIPETAEQLMRARYSAYFFRRVDYLVETTHPDTRSPTLKEELEEMIDQVNWSFLNVVEVIKGGKTDRKGIVEFIAEYYHEDEQHELHERAKFRRYKGAWKYWDTKKGSGGGEG